MDMNDKLHGGMIGLAVGDALGMPYETGARGSFDIYADVIDPITGSYKMTAYQKGMPAYWYGESMPEGCWTDDTAMTLAEIESIARLGRIDPEDIVQNFCRWNYEGAFSATGIAIGQGKQTIRALERYQNGTPAINCGGATKRDNGDGSLMRMIPFVFCEEMLAELGVTIGNLSSITHAHPISIKACEIYIDFARELLRSNSIAAACEVLKNLPEPYNRLYSIQSLTEKDINRSGYVVHAWEAALWSFLTTNDYSDCVLKAISLGGDTDTIAAITGSLAGLYYGIEAIPKSWREALCSKDIIDSLTDDFCNVI